MRKNYIKFILKNRDEKLRTDFLSESMEIVENEPSPLGHMIVIVITTLIVIFIAWSVFSKTEEIAIARGSVTTLSKSENIYTLKDGKVKEKYTYEGEKVSIGQELVEIDYDIEKVDLEHSKVECLTLEYELELLELLLNDINNPNILLDIKSNNETDKIAMYNLLNIQNTYLKKVESLSLQQNTLGYTDKETILKTEQLNEEIASHKSMKDNYNELNSSSITSLKISSLEEKLLTLEKEYSSYNELYTNGAISQVQLNDKHKEIVDTKNSLKILYSENNDENIQNNMKIKEIDASIGKLQHELKNQAINLDLSGVKSYSILKSIEIEKSNILTNLSERKTAIAKDVKKLELDIELKNKNIENSTLKSPIDGIVQNLTVGSKGSSVLSNNIIATIVPSDSNLIAEVLVLNKDIGYIQVGQKVSLKVDTFSFQKNGVIEGKISYISSDSVSNDNLGLVYPVKVTFDKSKLNKVYQDGIANGMQCTAEIVIKERRIIDFFFDSIIDHFDTSLKVR